MGRAALSAERVRARVGAAIFERVRAIHQQVTGIAPDGRPYAASDPRLLTWATH